ncbi:hypothetical protein UVI_02060950 [Ustilaginoidea virens]|uniref:Short chain dehydrogenase n=1 Tax=Ustilaginoidea virens TaxID=1159556 RepID=A0A1B5L1J0_USTVR|nr:hypothetical protein UVI_02060950 [Ustilaginoidea virens]
MPDMTQIACRIGWLVIGITILRALNLLYIHLRPSRFHRFAHVSPKGDQPWALVTGASDGIGKAFAQELAARGLNLVLHGRNHAKLTLVMSQLQRAYPKRSFRLLVADAGMVSCLSCTRPAGDNGDKARSGDKGPSDAAASAVATVEFSSIREAVADLHLTILVNNVGGAPSPAFLPVSQSSQSGTTGNISLNALFPFHLTRELLPLLAQNAPALVLNVGSLADAGFPFLATYGASKQFLMTWTRALGLELAFEGKAEPVEMLGLRVGRVTGASGHKEKPSWLVPDTRTMARAALDRAGYGSGIVVGHWAHALQDVGFHLLPKWVGDKIIISLMRRELATAQTKQSTSKQD